MKDSIQKIMSAGKVRVTAEERKEFVAGKRVRHFLFGDGEILKSEPSHGEWGAGGVAIEVRFDDGSVKTIEATVLPLEKFCVIAAT